MLNRMTPLDPSPSLFISAIQRRFAECEVAQRNRCTVSRQPLRPVGAHSFLLKPRGSHGGAGTSCQTSLELGAGCSLQIQRHLVVSAPLFPATGG